MGMLQRGWMDRQATERQIGKLLVSAILQLCGSRAVTDVSYYATYRTLYTPIDNIIEFLRILL